MSASGFTCWSSLFFFAGEFAKSNAKHRDLLMCLCMTSCDLSDQTKNWATVKKVAVRLTRARLLNVHVNSTALHCSRLAHRNSSTKNSSLKVTLNVRKVRSRWRWWTARRRAFPNCKSISSTKSHFRCSGELRTIVTAMSRLALTVLYFHVISARFRLLCLLMPQCPVVNTVQQKRRHLLCVCLEAMNSPLLYMYL